jgi:alpha-1,2-mannosyltransferase
MAVNPSLFRWTVSDGFQTSGRPAAGEHRHSRPWLRLLPPPRPFIAAASLIGLASVFGYLLVYVLFRLSHGHFGDFPTFYHAARAIVSGRDPYLAVEANLAYVYPPLYATACVPLAALGKLAAARVMLLINVGCALLALLACARELLWRFDAKPLPWANTLAVACFAALAAENELRGQLQAMETDALILLLFVLALRWLDRRPWSSGAALALAFSIKYQPLIFLPYLLVRRRWRAAASMTVWTIAFGLLPAIVLGFSTNGRYLRTALSGLLRWVGPSPGAGALDGGGFRVAQIHGLADAVSISLPSSAARWLQSHGHPTSWALLVAAAGSVFALALIACLYWRRSLPVLRWPCAAQQAELPWRGLVALEWLGLLSMILGMSPHTNTRHLVLAIPLEVAAIVMIVAPPIHGRRWPALLVICLLVVGFAMPFHGMFGNHFTHQYFRLSIVSWCLLAAYFLLLNAGLSYLAASTYAGHRRRHNGERHKRPEVITQHARRDLSAPRGRMA